MFDFGSVLGSEAARNQSAERSLPVQAEGSSLPRSELPLPTLCGPHPTRSGFCSQVHSFISPQSNELAPFFCIFHRPLTEHPRSGLYQLDGQLHLPVLGNHPAALPVPLLQDEDGTKTSSATQKHTGRLAIIRLKKFRLNSDFMQFMSGIQKIVLTKFSMAEFPRIRNTVKYFNSVIYRIPLNTEFR